MDNKMSVPVIILNWNGWDDTLECLHSLRESGEADEVWLVDNGSTRDRSSEAIAAYPGLRFLGWDQNYGYAGGYNRALKIALQEGFEFAYLLNNDSIVIPGFLDAVVKAARANDRVAAVGSRIIYADPANSVEFDGRHHAPGVRLPYFESGTKIVDMVVGAGMMVRLRAMEACGYFDERFFCYCEEAEWCFRIRDHGLVCAYCPDSTIIHKGHGSNQNANATYYRYRNILLLLDRLDKTAKKSETTKHLYQAAVAAEIARRSGNLQEWVSIARALHDGLRGRYGQRPDRAPILVPILRLCWLSLRAHFHDKWRSLRGKRPGYGESLRVWERGW